MKDIIRQFSDAIYSKGITPPKTIFPDGELHRFSANHKSTDPSGWYVLHGDGIPAGSFGDWRTGITVSWCAKSKDHMSAKEKLEYSRRLQNAKDMREKVKSQAQMQSAKRAQDLLNNSKPADPHHPYLIRKRILPFQARQRGEVLMLPVIDFSFQVWSLQFIDPEGKKKLLKGGAKKGRFIHVNGVLGQTGLLICEGFATGATLASAYPGKCVIAAIDAGNLEFVGIAARRHWPHMEIIICADDDRLNPANPGISKARNAAITAKAMFTAPQWPKEAPASLSDFNDLACWLSDRAMVAV